MCFGRHVRLILATAFPRDAVRAGPAVLVLWLVRAGPAALVPFLFCMRLSMCRSRRVIAPLHAFLPSASDLPSLGV